MKKLSYVIFILPFLFYCTKNNTNDSIAKVGKTTISKHEFDAFEKSRKMYPVDPGLYFPAFRSPITHLIETEIIYNKIPSSFLDSLKKTEDWKLKKSYFPAQIYLIDYLATNLGISDEQIGTFYEANKDSFKVVVKNDSTKKDSTYYLQISDVKGSIIDTLFLRSNAPDSLFLSGFDSLADPQTIRSEWIENVRRTLPSFFMKKVYAEVKGAKYPDSLSDIYGDGKIVTENEFDVILSWIQETRREHYRSTPERRRELVEWVLRWKLFSEYVMSNNLIPQQTLKKLLDWAWKSNAVYAYVSSVIAPNAESSTAVDTAMLLYLFYDENGYTFTGTGDNGFAVKIQHQQRDQVVQKIDSVIMHYRTQTKVSILQSDWFDIKNQKPDSLMKVADALRDSGKTNEAKDIYQTITKEFSFTPEGKNSLIELAKLQTEQQLYTQAISNYRKFLVNNGDHDKRCNTFFMIGFIYDEYLDKPLHAETNYKWVLKNTPDCELADDAEFMMLHLNEPMSSVEELRDEAIRQGRKVEETIGAEDDSTVVDTVSQK